MSKRVHSDFLALVFFSLRYHWSRSKSEMTPPTFQIQSLFSHTVLMRHHTSASIRRATPDVGGDIVSQNRGHRCSKSGRRWLIRVSPTRIIAGVLLAPAFWLYRKILNCYWKINKKTSGIDFTFIPRILGIINIAMIFFPPTLPGLWILICPCQKVIASLGLHPRLKCPIEISRSELSEAGKQYTWRKKLFCIPVLIIKTRYID